MLHCQASGQVSNVPERARIQQETLATEPRGNITGGGLAAL